MQQILSKGRLRDYVDPEGAKPQHIYTTTHECKDITTSPELDEITDGHVPVFTFITDSTGQARLQVREISISSGNSSSQPPFVAISHVRSHGLGNDGANTLPQCRITALEKLVDGLYEPGCRPVAFWIDTLCIPHSGPRRKSALRQIRRIFEICNRALVLDSKLCEIAISTSADALREIRDCPWMTRLWTLEECAMVENLYFQFRGGVHDLNELLESYEQAEASNFLPYYNAQELECIKSSADQFRLSRILGLFGDDLKMVITTGGESDSILFDQRELLRAILRLGYLSFAKFRYFVDLDTIARARPILRFLEEIYGNQRVPDGNSLEPSGEAVAQRLRRIVACVLLSIA